MLAAMDAGKAIDGVGAAMDDLGPALLDPTLEGPSNRLVQPRQLIRG